jgi:hypothetical protein
VDRDYPCCPAQDTHKTSVRRNISINKKFMCALQNSILKEIENRVTVMKLESYDYRTIPYCNDKLEKESYLYKHCRNC